ncbi:MAG TPA: FtsX-like permease family protein, partial [Acidimicrobiales bacterium]
MLSVSLRSAWGHKRRLLGTALAVFLGVAFLTGTLVLGDTLSANFDTLFAEVTAGTDAVVRNPTEIERSGNMPDQAGFVDEGVLDTVRAVDGVARAEPQIQGYGALIGRDGEAVGGNGPPRLAANWVDDPELNPYRLVEGRAPRADDEVVVNRGAAEDAGLTVGDRAVVQVPAPLDVTIVGIATFGDEDGLGATTYTAFTYEAAQRYLAGGQPRISSVLVAADPGVSQDELVDRLEPVVPDGTEVLTGAELTDDRVADINSTFLDMLRTFLTMFAGIALLVATFSIYNTFSIIVAQRTREMALLRAVGAARRQVLAAVVVEALAVGVVASVAGVVAGLGVAGLLKGMFDAFGFSLPAGGLVVTVGAVAVSLAVGVVATLVAAAAPAVRASRIAPLAALREVAVDRAGTSRARAVVGAVLLAAGVAAVLTGALADGGDGVLLAGLGAAVSLVGVVVVGPVVARPASGTLGAPLARLRGVGGTLARRNAMRNPRRTSATASALLVGVGVVVVFTVFAASLKSSLTGAVDRTFGADLVVAAPVFGGAGLDPDMAGQIADLPEVDAAVGLGTGAATVGGRDRGVVTADPAALDRVLDLDVSAGSLPDLRDDQIAVPDTVADDRGWALGDTVPITFVDGARQDFTVGAVFDESSIVDGVLLTRDAWAPHAQQDLDLGVYVALADGVGLDAGRDAVAGVVDRFDGPDVQDRDEYAASLTQGLDMMLGIVYVLLALAIVIALMGIANTLSLSVHERRRELGVLRAVGQTRGQLRAMVRWESVLIAVFGTVGGLGLGVFLGWAMVRAAASASGLGSFTAPVGQLAVVLVAGAVAGVLAGLRPARRAARLDVLDAIAAGD